MTRLTWFSLPNPSLNNPWRGYMPTCCMALGLRLHFGRTMAVQRRMCLHAGICHLKQLYGWGLHGHVGWGALGRRCCTSSRNERHRDFVPQCQRFALAASAWVWEGRGRGCTLKPGFNARVSAVPAAAALQITNCISSERPLLSMCVSAACHLPYLTLFPDI